MTLHRRPTFRVTFELLSRNPKNLLSGFLVSQINSWGFGGRLGGQEFHKCTVGTKIIADPKKSFRELISEKLLILLRGRPCLELILVSSNFRALLFFAGQIAGISLKAMNFSKNV